MAAPTEDDPLPNAPVPTRFCPLCDGEMRVEDRSKYATTYACPPCRVRVLYPAEADHRS
jgi:uncharacterized protein YlaI